MPLGYKPKFVIHGEKMVCKLNKSIYGLKQASRQWFAKFSHFLTSLGFQHSKADYYLFVKGQGIDFLALLVYVDDIITNGANISLIRSLQSMLNHKFLRKDLGSPKFFLGRELTRSSTEIFLSQRHYTLRLLEDVGLLGVKPVIMSMDPTIKLKSAKKDFLQDPTAYRGLIGKLLYLDYFKVWYYFCST